MEKQDQTKKVIDEASSCTYPTYKALVKALNSSAPLTNAEMHELGFIRDRINGSTMPFASKFLLFADFTRGLNLTQHKALLKAFRLGMASVLTYYENDRYMAEIVFN